ncbi:MAG: hypothetical protein ACTHNN_11455 [Xanthobacteraceae bacterium]
MSGFCLNGLDRQASPRKAAAINITDGLALVASPICAGMAVLTAMSGNSSAEMLCSAVHMSPLSGMATMYVLMSAFHAAPWIRLIRTRFADTPLFRPRE